MTSFQIGPYTLASNLFVAPMAGVADAPFRAVCRDYGAGLSTSEMLTSDLSIWHQPKSQYRLRWADNETPVSVQLAGTDPEQMVAAAQQCQALGAKIIDINMGCPAKKVCKKAAGSALMENPSLIADILGSVVTAVDCPVTVKTRTGPDLSQRNAVLIAKICEDQGAQALAIHGRTRACKFAGSVEYDTIAEVKQSVKIPVIANGDINTIEKAAFVLNYTGADGLMVGRGALGKPWFFRQILEFLVEGTVHYAPSRQDIEQTLLKHVNAIHQFYGETKSIGFVRKHVRWYFDHLPQSSGFWEAFNQLQHPADQIEQLMIYFEQIDL